MMIHHPMLGILLIMAVFCAVGVIASFAWFLTSPPPGHGSNSLNDKLEEIGGQVINFILYVFAVE